jgi:endonuclease YncB( thermonuclease family)
MGGCATKQPSLEDVQMIQLQSCTDETVEEVIYRFTKAKVLKVYDGDSCTIAAHYGGQICKFNVRIFGIDCDEMKGGTEKTKHNARLAKKFVEKMILGKIVDINVLNNKIVDGKKLKEKFGRLLATISIDGHDLANALLEAGLARKYYGGKKETTALHPNVDMSVASSEEKMSDGGGKHIEY